MPRNRLAFSIAFKILILLWEWDIKKENAARKLWITPEEVNAKSYQVHKNNFKEIAEFLKQSCLGSTFYVLAASFKCVPSAEGIMCLTHVLAQD